MAPKRETIHAHAHVLSWKRSRDYAGHGMLISRPNQHEIVAGDMRNKNISSDSARK